VKIKINSGVVARKYPKKKSNTEDDFVPLLEGNYTLGPEIEGRLQVLREGKSAVFLEAERYQAHLANGDIELDC
jgi:uncharacterized cupin superfamily protein